MSTDETKIEQAALAALLSAVVKKISEKDKALADAIKEEATKTIRRDTPLPLQSTAIERMKKMLPRGY